MYIQRTWLECEVKSLLKSFTEAGLAAELSELCARSRKKQLVSHIHTTHHAYTQTTPTRIQAAVQGRQPEQRERGGVHNLKQLQVGEPLLHGVGVAGAGCPVM